MKTPKTFWRVLEELHRRCLRRCRVAMPTVWSYFSNVLGKHPWRELGHLCEVTAWHKRDKHHWSKEIALLDVNGQFISSVSDLSFTSSIRRQSSNRTVWNKKAKVWFLHKETQIHPKAVFTVQFWANPVYSNHIRDTFLCGVVLDKIFIISFSWLSLLQYLWRKCDGSHVNQHVDLCTSLQGKRLFTLTNTCEWLQQKKDRYLNKQYGFVTLTLLWESTHWYILCVVLCSTWDMINNAVLFLRLQFADVYGVEEVLHSLHNARWGLLVKVSEL